MLDSVLTKAEEVRSGDRVRMLPVPYGVRLFYNVGPGTGCSTSDNRAIGGIRGDNLELRAVTAIQDGAMINNFHASIDRRKVSPR